MKDKLTKCLLLLFFFVLGGTTQGHPSWGIVISPNGEIYFSDILHGGEGTIWKIDQKGNLHPFIKEYHAHGLCIDQNGIFWISANRYIEGVIEGEGEHVLIKVLPDGTQEEIVRTRNPKEFFGGTTTLDLEGNMIYSYQKQLYKRSPEGKVNLFIDHTFERIITLFTGRDGSIYVSDKNYLDGTIYRVSPEGQLSAIASNLVDTNPSNPPFPNPMHHLLYGMGDDAAGNIYVAESTSRQVLKIDKTGKVSNFFTSQYPWYPTGIVFKEDTAYVLEVGYSDHHLGPRVLEIIPNKQATILVNVEDYEENKPLREDSSPIETPKTPFPWLLFLIIPVLLAGFIFGRKFILVLCPGMRFK